ncbi:MAG: hypothetical protein ABIB79_04050 [archaeon]
MVHTGLSKSDIEKQIGGKGDFIQIHHLNQILNEPLIRDTKKFVYMKLAEIYERNRMFNDAARMCDGLAIISIAFTEKVKNHVREAELYIRSGDFRRADGAMKKAMNEANPHEKSEVYYVVKDLYKKQAREYEREMKRNKASQIYEKLLEMNITHLERREIKEKLLGLYKLLGKFDKVKLLEGMRG